MKETKKETPAVDSSNMLGGEKSLKAPKLELKSSSKEKSSLPDDALVVRGGQSAPDNLIENQANDKRGHISANSKAGTDLKTLATTPEPFRNGQISVSTVGEIRNVNNDHGQPMDVIEDPTSGNPVHASIDPFNLKLSKDEAVRLSDVFKRQKNEFKIQ